MKIFNRLFSGLFLVVQCQDIFDISCKVLNFAVMLYELLLYRSKTKTATSS